jgi:hypothetical protein
MNDYITLDGYKYATNAKKWDEVKSKPATERYTLSGVLDITYGAAFPQAWEGEINAPVTARAEGWGTFTTLSATLAKKSGVVFVDHYGSSYTIHCLGELRPRSLFHRWDSVANIFYVFVRLVKERDPEAPAITSPNVVDFYESSEKTFRITATGYPIPAIILAGSLPAGLTFVDNNDGTATISGTPDVGIQGNYGLDITATNGVLPNATQELTLTVNPSSVAPEITSAAIATFEVGSAGSFTVTATGFPTSEIEVAGALPSGVTFVDNKDGTGMLSGTPGAGSGGLHNLTFTASNGEGDDDIQGFTLEVNEAPEITSAATASLNSGSSDSFTITATGYPIPALSSAGSLPGGVTFTDNENGTATIKGPAAYGTAGDYPLTITADNDIGSNDDQSFTLTIIETDPIVPVNSLVLWYGNSTNVPSGCEIFSSAKGNLIMGCALGNQNLVSAGALTHTHGMSVVQSAAHTHTVGDLSTTSAAGSTTTYGPSGSAVMAGGHTHSKSGTPTASNEEAHLHTMPATGSASNLPTYRRLYWIKVLDGHLPLGAIVPFNGNLAAIPAGFTLCDGDLVSGFQTPDLRGKYIYGASVDGDVNSIGGANSHAHTVGVSSVRANHHHTVSGGSVTGGSTVNVYLLGEGSTAIAGNHTHSISSGVSSDNGGHSHSGNPNTSAESVEPPYQELHYIMRVTTGDLPSGSIVAFEGSILPSGYYVCNGGNGTPNLIDKFIKGDSADSFTSGGAASHTHANSGLSTVSAGSHSHGGTRTTGGSGSTNSYGGTGVSASPPNHTHTIGFNALTNGEHAHNYEESGIGSNLPPYIKLCFLMKA